MKKPLRVLLVEDSEDDAFLLERELDRGGFAVTSARVDTAAALEAALERERWDLIISDHSIPGFGSLDALEMLRRKQRDIPFIVVSGGVGEEVAVRTMKAGASDYVLKDQLPRLIPSIERELREAENRKSRRQTEEALHETEAYLAAIVENSEDAIIGIAPNGAIRTWNAGAEHLYGYRAEEVRGKPISILIPDCPEGELPEQYMRVREGKTLERFEAGRRRKDGTTMPVSVALSPIKDRDGKVIGVSAIEQDISAQKHEEADRLRWIDELTMALAKIRTLRGLLPICASCKKIRDDHGYWQKVESYLAEHTEAEFTHGICPDCLKRLYPEYAARVKGEGDGKK